MKNALTLSLRVFFLILKPYRPIYGTPVAKALKDSLLTTFENLKTTFGGIK